MSAAHAPARGDRNERLREIAEWQRCGGWTRTEAAALLTRAAQRLQSEYPEKRKALFIFQIFPHRHEYQTRFEWPGVVVVFERHSGRRIVESKPGEPATVGTWCSEGEPFAELP